jgi:hypothetical protein
MSIRRSVLSHLFGVTSFAALFGVAACGPVSGPWGTFGGEWKYVCGAPRQLGEACNDFRMCATGLYCVESGSGALGVCQPRIAAGGPCKLTEDCKDGLVCRNGALTGECYFQTCDKNNVCTQGAASGAKCDANGLNCPANQICGLSTQQPGTCIAAPKVGDDCSQNASYFQCGPSLACQRGTLKCVTTPKAGEVCGLPPLQCGPGLVCPSSTDPNKQDVCGTPIPVGGHCDFGGLCAKGSHCDLGKLVCTVNKKVGDSCKNGNECGEKPLDVGHGVDCVQGTCVDTSVSGAKCWPGIDQQCTNGLTCVPKP